MDKSFRDKLVLVSGAGEGIGKEIATSFAKEGANIAFFDKRREKVNEVKKELDLLGVKVIAEVIDITRIEQLEFFIKTIENKIGITDILINNVGIGLVKKFYATNQKDFDLVLSTNLKGPFFLTQKVTEKMKNGSSVIFVTSIHAKYPSLDPTYDASKAAINSLVLNLALELAKKGIRVNAIAPGHIDTKDGKNPRYQEDVPLGKMAGVSADIAQSCLYLADPIKAKYVTGIILPVTGGLHIPRAADTNL